jgi:hypothetical protein
VTVSFADRLAADLDEHKIGPQCSTCTALNELSPDDLGAYRAAVTGGVSRAAIARALGIQPGTYRTHVAARHVDPR